MPIMNADDLTPNPEMTPLRSERGTKMRILVIGAAGTMAGRFVLNYPTTSTAILLGEPTSLPITVRVR
jgi:hypothetical protein